MITLRQIVPALCLATSLSAVAVYAQTTAPSAPVSDSAGGRGWGHHGHHGGGMGEMGLVLHKLNLTPEQKTQVKSIFAGQKAQFETLHESAKSNRQALATTPPNDPGYPALIQTAQTNAGARIALMSQTWKQVYENVLTKPQRDQVPGIVAAAQAARESKMAAWKAQHPQPNSEPLAN
jgi:Spy/CpxP family protein refolding chaperone